MSLRQARAAMVAALVRVVAVLTISACADAPFERISAWDGQFTTSGKIVGLPDTLTAVGDSVQLTVDAGERYRNVQRRWSVRQIDFEACPLGCGSVQVGEFTGKLVASPTSYPRRWEVRVLMGVQQYLDTVTTRQVPSGFRLLCDADTGCGTSDYDAPLDFLLTSVQLVDANKVPLLYQPDSAKLAGASFSTRDPRIVDIVDGTPRSRFADGRTWILRHQFGTVDSVQWTVQQQLGSLHVNCPATAAVSDTVRLVVTARDVRGAPMNTPVTFTWLLWYGFVWDTFSRPIAQNGSFVPTEPGDWFVTVLGAHPTAGRGADCKVLVR